MGEGIRNFKQLEYSMDFTDLHVFAIGKWYCRILNFLNQDKNFDMLTIPNTKNAQNLTLVMLTVWL
jgi:hypothetical protein